MPGLGSACGRSAHRARAAGRLVPQVGLGLAGRALADGSDDAGDDRRECQLLEHAEYLLGHAAPRVRTPRCVSAPGAPAHGWAWEDLNLRPHPYQGCALTV